MGYFIMDNFGFVDTYIEENLETQSIEISRMLLKDCPHFVKFQSHIRSRFFEGDELQASHHEHTHPVRQLNTYVYSLESLCWHMLYSMLRFNMLADWVMSPGGQSSSISYYISYYFFDSISRGKAVADILGLLINHVFDLKLDVKQCALDRGRVARKLAERYNENKGLRHGDNLYRNLDRHRNEWLMDFYELRNTVIHRYEFSVLAMSVAYMDTSGDFERIIPFHLDFRNASQALVQIQKIVPNSIVAGFDVDPLFFYTGLWSRFVALVECVCKDCLPQVDIFVASHSMPQ